MIPNRDGGLRKIPSDLAEGLSGSTATSRMTPSALRIRRDCAPEMVPRPRRLGIMRPHAEAIGRISSYQAPVTLFFSPESMELLSSGYWLRGRVQWLAY